MAGATAKRDPDACPVHRHASDPVCQHCVPIAQRLAIILMAIEASPDQRAVTPAARRRYADIVLRFCARDFAGAVSIPGEEEKAFAALQRAARWSAAAEGA